MNFDMPKVVFCGLALIAAAIFFGPGSASATAQGKIQKVQVCDQFVTCAGLQQRCDTRQVALNVYQPMKPPGR
jgi:hypothetical protein